MDWSLFWSIGLTLFAATTVVRVAGFGGSLVSMPLLVPLIGLPAATPVMTLFGITTFSIAIGQRWRDVTIKDIWRLTTMSVLVAPLGIYLIYVAPESVLRLSLGVTCILYALYRLFKLPFPQLKNPNWGWLFGAFAGLASGAFSVGGVPTVIYANTQAWEPERFRLLSRYRAQKSYCRRELGEVEKWATPRPEPEPRPAPESAPEETGEQEHSEGHAPDAASLSVSVALPPRSFRLRSSRARVGRYHAVCGRRRWLRGFWSGRRGARRC